MKKSKLIQIFFKKNAPKKFYKLKKLSFELEFSTEDGTILPTLWVSKDAIYIQDSFQLIEDYASSMYGAQSRKLKVIDLMTKELREVKRIVQMDKNAYVYEPHAVNCLLYTRKTAPKEKKLLKEYFDWLKKNQEE